MQHDDLHMANVYAQGGRRRLLDWGGASVSHPFASLVVTFRFLEERNQLPPGDPWVGRLRDAYLKLWGRGLAGAFPLAVRVGRPRASSPGRGSGTTFRGGTSRVRPRVLGRAGARGRPDAPIARHASAASTGPPSAANGRAGPTNRPDWDAIGQHAHHFGRGW